MNLIRRRTPQQKLERLYLEVARLGGKRHDPTLEHMSEIAAELDATNYAGGWVNLLNWQDLNVAPASVNTFTTTTCILSPAPRPYIPANSVAIGTRFRMRTWGSIASAAGTATFTIGTAFNGTGGTPIMASAAQTPATGPLPFWYEAELTVLQIGAASTASIIGQGLCHGLGATPATAILVPATAPTALATTFFTTSAWNLTPNSVCSSGVSGNAFVTYGMTVEQLN